MINPGQMLLRAIHVDHLISSSAPAAFWNFRAVEG
jgi:hypothetical protein